MTTDQPAAPSAEPRQFPCDFCGSTEHLTDDHLIAGRAARAAPPADDLCAKNPWDADGGICLGRVALREQAKRIEALTKECKVLQECAATERDAKVTAEAERDQLHEQLGSMALRHNARIEALMKTHTSDGGVVWHPADAWTHCVTVKYGERQRKRAEAAEARVAELEEALENMVNDPALVCSYVRLNAARAALARAAPTRGDKDAD
jgi:hypothetical protein